MAPSQRPSSLTRHCTRLDRETCILPEYDRVQGLDWYRQDLRQDKDGDVANEFLEEATDQDRTAGGTCTPLQVCASEILAAFGIWPSCTGLPQYKELSGATCCSQAKFSFLNYLYLC